MSNSASVPQVVPPPLPPGVIDEVKRAVTCERLRLLSIAFYISGALGAAFISILLIHFFVFAAISFMPETAFEPPSGQQSASQTPAVQKSDPFPPRIILRVVAGFFGVIILCGWTLGGLTIYAGRCIAKRQRRMFVLVMAGFNCLWVPYGTLLGIVTILALSSEDAKQEYT